VADEHHLAVGCPAHAAPTSGDGADLQLQELWAGGRTRAAYSVCFARRRGVGQGGHVGRA
jgi:hypothetical protein